MYGRESNIRVLHYPDLDFTKEYPSIGPNGKQKANINGSACSIELYLGLDILTIDGQLSPIHWKGYDDSLKQYQGEIQNKKLIQKAFFEKLKLCTDNPKLLERTDWSSIRLILQSVFNAFS